MGKTRERLLSTTLGRAGICGLLLFGSGPRCAGVDSRADSGNGPVDAGIDSGIDSGDDAGPPCNSFTHDYTCEGNTLQYCSAEGTVEEIDCAALGATCVPGTPGCNAPIDQCPQNARAGCLSETVMTVITSLYATCGAIPCPEGQVCTEESLLVPDFANGRCVLPEMIPCDETYVESCASDDRVRFCANGYVSERACDPEEVCVQGRCRWQDATSCDPATFTPYCDGSARVVCGADGQTDRHPCPAGLTCLVLADAELICVADPPTPCDQETFQLQCVQEWAARTCVSGYEYFTFCTNCVCDETGCECFQAG